MMPRSCFSAFCCVLLTCRVQAAYFQTLQARISSEDDRLDPIWKNILPLSTTSVERNLATPMFWHIHKSGGTTVHDVLGSCLNLTVASHIGVDNGHDSDQVRQMILIEISEKVLENVRQRHWSCMLFSMFDDTSSEIKTDHNLSQYLC
jgi:hypothetical protein